MLAIVLTAGGAGAAKLQSPRDAGSADNLNAPMVKILTPPVPAGANGITGTNGSNDTSNVATPPVMVTNNGAVTAYFEQTQIQGLVAGFVYRTNPTNGPWKVLGTVPYPTNGGLVTLNYIGTNIPALYFKAFYQFPNPTP